MFTTGPVCDAFKHLKLACSNLISYNTMYSTLQHSLRVQPYNALCRYHIHMVWQLTANKATQRGRVDSYHVKLVHVGQWGPALAAINCCTLDGKTTNTAADGQRLQPPASCFTNSSSPPSLPSSSIPSGTHPSNSGLRPFQLECHSDMPAGAPLWIADSRSVPWKYKRRAVPRRPGRAAAGQSSLTRGTTALFLSMEWKAAPATAAIHRQSQ